MALSTKTIQYFAINGYVISINGETRVIYSTIDPRRYILDQLFKIIQLGDNMWEVSTQWLYKQLTGEVAVFNTQFSYYIFRYKNVAERLDHYIYEKLLNQNNGNHKEKRFLR